MARTQIDLLKGSILKVMIAFAIPFLVSNILQQLYNTVDTIIVGYNLGDASLAAIGASGPLYNLLVGLALGIGSGMSIVLGRNYGAGDQERLKSSVAATLIIGTIVTIALMILSRLTIMPLLRLLETPLEIMDEAYSYIAVITSFVGVMMAFNVFSGILRAIGDSVMPLIFLAISALANIGLDLLFIKSFRMGIRGAAIATIIAQGLSAVLCLIYIFKKCPFLIPAKKHFAFDKELYADLVSQGVSMGLMNSLVNLGSLVMQYAINTLGYLAIAGYLAGKKLFFFTVMPLVAMCSSLSAFVAQNKGADQGFRIRKAVKYANLISITWAAFVIVFAHYAAPVLVRLLTGSEDMTVITYGVRFIRLVTPFYLVLGPLFNLRYALQSLGRKVIPLVSSIIELIGKVIFTFWIFPFTGYPGIILCEPAIWCIMFVQLFFAFYGDPYVKAHRHEQQYIRTM